MTVKKRKAPTKKELEDKVNKLQEQLEYLDTQLKKNDKVYGESHVSVDMVKEIRDAKINSEKRAGLVKNTNDGSVLPEDNIEDIRFPTQSIHTFDDLEFCKCECHPSKRDCMYCYDHPTHLEGKMKSKEIQVEDIEEIPIKKDSWFDKLKKL